MSINFSITSKPATPIKNYYNNSTKNQPCNFGAETTKATEEKKSTIKYVGAALALAALDGGGISFCRKDQRRIIKELHNKLKAFVIERSDDAAKGVNKGGGTQANQVNADATPKLNKNSTLVRNNLGDIVSVIEETKRSDGSRIIEKTDFKTGELISLREIQKDGSEIAAWKGVFDSLVAGKGELGSFVASAFDKNHKLIYGMEELEDGTFFTRVFENDKTIHETVEAVAQDGSKIKEEYGKDYELIREMKERVDGSKIEKEYDKKGNLTSYIEERKDGSKIASRIGEDGSKIEEEYDKKDNLIKRTEIQKDGFIFQEIIGEDGSWESLLGR